MRGYGKAALVAALLLSPAALAGHEPVLAAEQSPPPSSVPSPTAAEPAHIDGFRSAQWGMTDAQVKAAITKDFNIAPDKVENEENRAERTTSLGVTVPGLVEGAGSARVTYIFGYTSKKLIQVNILWGRPVDLQASAENIVAAANELRQLFVDSGYDPATVITNAKMSDGSILVFQGQDADKHTTVLRLKSDTVTPPSRGGKPEKPVVTASLSLSYILDAHTPDIFRLKKGQF